MWKLKTDFSFLVTKIQNVSFSERFENVRKNALNIYPFEVKSKGQTRPSGAREVGDHDGSGVDADFRFRPGEDPLNRRGDAENALFT